MSNGCNKFLSIVISNFIQRNSLKKLFPERLILCDHIDSHYSGYIATRNYFIWFFNEFFLRIGRITLSVVDFESVRFMDLSTFPRVIIKVHSEPKIPSRIDVHVKIWDRTIVRLP
jgi:hypothetical protein